MADSPGGAKVPQTFGEKLAFSIPVIIVTLILAVGIAFAIAMILDGKTREHFTKLHDEEQTQRKKEVGELQKANDDLAKEVTVASDKAKRLDESNKALVAELGSLGTKLQTVSNEYAKFAEGQAVMDTTQNKDIAANKDDINKVDKRVVYVEEKLKKLDEIAKDVDTLKGDTATLKKEYTVLREDLTTTSKKAEITDKDLTELSERARLFQLRVLAARAREAADAARATDLKSLLDRLGDVEGNK
jgi:hypothetical protein